MNIELLIDSLILYGLPADRDAVAAAVERELGRLLAERGVPPGLGAEAAIAVSPPALRVPTGTRSEAIGARVAESIYAGMGGGSAGDPRR